MQPISHFLVVNRTFRQNYFRYQKETTKEHNIMGEYEQVVLGTKDKQTAQNFDI